MTEDSRFVVSFINGSPGLVVRGETGEDVDKAIREILPIFKKFRTAVEKGAEKKAEELSPKATCEACGTAMQYKDGFSKKTNKKWKGLFCPQDKEHNPIWL